MDLKNTEKISMITCYDTNLIVVLYSDTIDKWILNGLKLDARWRKPMSCDEQESIRLIRMNSQYYALVINKVDGYHFELRNTAMSRIGNVKIIYDYSQNLISLPNDSRWLFLDRYQNQNCLFIIDNQLNIHEQKYTSAARIKDIVVQGKTVIIHYVEQGNDVSATKRGRIEYYEWKQRIYDLQS